MRKPSVILDTNILISAHLKESGLEYCAFELALAGDFSLFISPQVLEEYRRVLIRPKFPFSAMKVQDSLNRIRKSGILVEPAFTLRVSTDESDNRFLECAEAAGADFLVTGNRRHFPQVWKTTRIVGTREFFDLVLPI